MNPNECQHHIDPVSNRLRKLTEANRSLAEIEALDDLFPRLMDLAKDVMAAEASVLFLHNPENRLLEAASIKCDTNARRELALICCGRRWQGASCSTDDGGTFSQNTPHGAAPY
jgi:hypothetical protein